VVEKHWRMENHLVNGEGGLYIVYLWERNDTLSLVNDFQGLSENVLDREQGRKEEKEKEWGKVLKE